MLSLRLWISFSIQIARFDRLFVAAAEHPGAGKRQTAIYPRRVEGGRGIAGPGFPGQRLHESVWVTKVVGPAAHAGTISSSQRALSRNR